MDSKDFYTIDSSLPLPVLLDTDVIRQKMALKPQLILYIANSIEESQIYSDLYIFPLYTHDYKSIIVTNDVENIESVFTTILTERQIYFVIIFMIENDVNVVIPNIKGNEIKMDLKKNLKATENISDILFPDTLNNINGMALKITFVDSTVVFIGHDKIISEITYFLEIIQQKLNAKLEFIEIAKDPESSVSDELRKIGNELDLHMNYRFNKLIGVVETYETEQICFIIPVPKPISIVDQIFFKPLDKEVWWFLGISIGVSALIWRLYRNLGADESTLNFLFGIYSLFVMQGRMFKVKSFILKLLLQILIFSTFLLSNGYQSLITSFMLKPLEERRIKTIDELLDSNYIIRYFEYVDHNLQENPKYIKAFEEGRIIEENIDLESYGRDKVVYTFPCREFDSLTKYDKANEDFYRTVESVSQQHLQIYVGGYSPYLNKFKLLMDLSFEAGLPKAWKMLYDFEYSVFWNIATNRTRFPESESEILDLTLMAPLFFILTFGFLMALFALFCEIFYHDFLSKLGKEHFNIDFKLCELFHIKERRRIIKFVKSVSNRKNENEFMELHS